MSIFIVAFLGILTFNYIWAIYTTVKKEKIMIEQGEGSLPASTYGFITVRHLTRALFYLLTLTYTPVAIGEFILDPNTYLFWIFLAFLVLGVIVEILSATTETLVRFAYMNITYRKMKREESKQ